MATKCIRIAALWMLFGSLLVLGAAGCVRRVPPPEAYAPPAAVAPSAVTPAPANVRRFVVTETQEHYYVDSRGGMHRIVREVTPPTGGGLFYYVENDERPYSIDEVQRLYYRDPSGKTYYIEDVNPARVVTPEEAMRAGVPSGIVPPTYPQTYPTTYPPTYPQTYPQTYPTTYPMAYPPAYPTTYPMAYPRESCASQWEKCMSGCQGISPRQAYSRPECISNCEAIRSNCH